MLLPDANLEGPWILEILRRWSQTGRPDPSPEYGFESKTGRAWIWVKSGQVFRRDGETISKLADPDTVALVYLAHVGELPPKRDGGPVSGEPVTPSKASDPIVPGGGMDAHCRERGTLGCDRSPGHQASHQTPWGVN